MRRIVDRTFEVRARLETAWKVLADLESWPSWAPHIRSVEKSPPGPLGPDTRGALVLSTGIRSTFRMTEFVPGRSWIWVGPFLGSEIRYGHEFTPGTGTTRIRFVVDARGWSLVLVGWLFGRIYRRNLERAIPRLIERIERRG